MLHALCLIMVLEYFILGIIKAHVIDKLRNLTKSPWSKFLLHLITNNGLIMYPNQQ
jgi:hypothetical protein